MILNVHLNNKPTDYGLERCNVAVIVELKHDEFITLNCRPLDYYDFITDNKDKLQYDNNAVIDCFNHEEEELRMELINHMEKLYNELVPPEVKEKVDQNPRRA